MGHLSPILNAQVGRRLLDLWLDLHNDSFIMPVERQNSNPFTFRKLQLYCLYYSCLFGSSIYTRVNISKNTLSLIVHI